MLKAGVDLMFKEQKHRAFYLARTPKSIILAIASATPIRKLPPRRRSSGLSLWNAPWLTDRTVYEILISMGYIDDRKGICNTFWLHHGIACSHLKLSNLNLQTRSTKVRGVTPATPLLAIPLIHLQLHM